MGMTREEAKAFLTDISYDLGTVGIEYLSVKDGEKMRNAIKALEQEPRKAIWIERSDIPIGCGEYLCSDCMDEYGTDLLYAYCPNCGAYHGRNKETIKEKDFYREHPEKLREISEVLEDGNKFIL